MKALFGLALVVLIGGCVRDVSEPGTQTSPVRGTISLPISEEEELNFVELEATGLFISEDTSRLTGWIVNPTNSSVAFASAAFRWNGSEGTDEVSVFSISDIILPHERSPFLARIPRDFPPNAVRHARGEISSADTHRFVITINERTDSDFATNVSGSVRGDRAAENVRVWVAATDAEDHVLDVSSATIDRIAAGGEGHFTIRLRPMEQATRIEAGASSP
ncbi:MAG TPA: hypothetical protein VM370_01420 [Candidatus Thermoplasmatota archaeon]|nr:hypothetical protein [Candidatus Thermoplasmatota archaeon]